MAGQPTFIIHWLEQIKFRIFSPFLPMKRKGIFGHSKTQNSLISCTGLPSSVYFWAHNKLSLLEGNDASCILSKWIFCCNV